MGNSLYNNGLQNFTLSATDPQMDSGSGEYLALSKSWLPKSSRESTSAIEHRSHFCWSPCSPFWLRQSSALANPWPTRVNNSFCPKSIEFERSRVYLCYA